MSPWRYELNIAKSYELDTAPASLSSLRRVNVSRLCSRIGGHGLGSGSNQASSAPSFWRGFFYLVVESTFQNGDAANISSDMCLFVAQSWTLASVVRSKMDSQRYHTCRPMPVSWVGCLMQVPADRLASRPARSEDAQVPFRRRTSSTGLVLPAA